MEGAGSPHPTYIPFILSVVSIPRIVEVEYEGLRFCWFCVLCMDFFCWNVSVGASSSACVHDSEIPDFVRRINVMMRACE